MASEIKVDTVSEKTSANGVTIDGLSIKDSKLVTANSVIEANMSADSVDSDSYVDGSIDTAHIADGQVTIGKLSTAVLTGATDIGAAIVDADLLLVDDGAGGTLRKTAASRIKTYIGDNTPSFYAYLGSDQTFATATDTKVTLDTEGWDTDSAFASNKFTVPSNEGGKYLFNFSGKTDLAIDTFAYISVRVNNSTVVRSTQGTVKPNATGNALLNSSVIVALDATDYVELFIYQNSGSNQLAYANYCSLMGCKLIGV